jgi:hypothetical protein
MSGTKRSGGKATTREAKAAKVAAAAARWGNAPGAPMKKAIETTALESLSDHDAAIGLPVTWGDSLKRKQVVEQDLINDRRRVELEEAKMKLESARSRLVDRAELDRAVAKVRDSWWREAQQIPGLVLPRLTDLPGETRARVKVAVEVEVAAAAERVKASMT